MEVWTGFVVGLLGSLHCVGMCGPIVAALPQGEGGKLSFLYGRLLYNSGTSRHLCADRAVIWSDRQDDLHGGISTRSVDCHWSGDHLGSNNAIALFAGVDICAGAKQALRSHQQDVGPAVSLKQKVIAVCHRHSQRPSCRAGSFTLRWRVRSRPEGRLRGRRIWRCLALARFRFCWLFR